MPTSVRGQALALREARFSDYEQIASVEDRNGLSPRSRDEWLHLWANNPVYQRLRDWPIGWVLENPEGRLVGSVGNIPIEYELDGKRLLVSAGRAWAVDPEYRSYSIVLMDELFRQQGVDLLLNTTVNKHAADAYALFESVRVPVGKWDRSGFWITHYPGFARSALTSRNWRFAAGLAAYPAAALLYLRDLWGGRPRRGQRRFDIQVLAGFDERFDAFWEQLRERQRGILLGVRTSRILEWHFRYRLRAGRVHILTVERDGSMVAYAIFTRQDKRRYGLKRCRLVDYQSLEDDPELFRALFDKQLDICRRDRVHMLEDLGCCAQHIQAPRYRELPAWLYYYKAGDAALSERLRDKANWRPSMYDGDSSL